MQRLQNPEEITPLTIFPIVLWAQRSSESEAQKNIIYLTVTAPDVPQDAMKLDLQPTKLTLTGKSSTKDVTYHVELEFFAEVGIPGLENTEFH